MANVFDCSIIQLPKIHNRAGNITIVENSLTLPFDIERIYYLYDIPGGENRGGHGHRKLQQLIIATSGSFDIVLDDGHCKKVVNLNRPDFGLYIKPGIWRELINFSSGSICLVLASSPYTETDYIRDYNKFLDFKSNG
jgi:hypothetical protein